MNPSVGQQDVRSSTPPVSSFLLLPVEIRMKIYRWLIPHDTRFLISHDRFSYPGGGSCSRVALWHLHRPVHPWTSPKDMAVLRLNHTISSEALDVLYGENHFVFEVNGYVRSTSRLTGPEATQLRPIRTGANNFQRLRRVELVVKLTRDESSSVRHLRHRLESLSTTLASRQLNDGTVIRSLNIRFNAYIAIVHGCRYLGQRRASEMRWQYVLEELIRLRRVAKVTVAGVDEWFARSLENALMGRGGQLHEIQYPNIERKRRKSGGVKRRVEHMTSRVWHMPKHDWIRFANDNGFLARGKNDGKEIAENTQNDGLGQES